MLLNGREIIVQCHFLYFFQLVALQLLCSASGPKCAGSNRAACFIYDIIYVYDQQKYINCVRSAEIYQLCKISRSIYSPNYLFFKIYCIPDNLRRKFPNRPKIGCFTTVDSF